MTDQFVDANKMVPITPAPELIRQWNEKAATAPMADQRYIAIQAARWGADQELEACCEWVYNSEYCQPHAVLHLRAARRPKPPSLAEQALKALLHMDQGQHNERAMIVRRALERLQELEQN